MEIGKKAIMAGIGMFLLGGVCVYLFITAQPEATSEKRSTRQHGAMRAAIEQIDNKDDATPASEMITHSSVSNNVAETDKPEMTHSAFLAEAEERREQQLINDAETKRLNKLRRIKQNSVECKFWKQQEQTSSAAAKIAANIEEHCLLAIDRSNSSSSSSTANN
ncbi:MAG: hypothetical protein B0W54_12110 [Cellvibrio sp. 79]|nr:MAG: hypothetical protein B0W54_12110 [Cellvibrio sp. 79]